MANPVIDAVQITPLLPSYVPGTVVRVKAFVHDDDNQTLSFQLLVTDDTGNQVVLPVGPLVRSDKLTCTLTGPVPIVQVSATEWDVTL